MGVTHPWAADIGFATMSQFFAGQPSVGTPGYIVIDLATMQVVDKQEGMSDTPGLYSSYLR